MYGLQTNFNRSFKSILQYFKLYAHGINDLALPFLGEKITLIASREILT